MTTAVLTLVAIGGILIFLYLSSLKPNRALHTHPQRNAVTLKRDGSGLVQITISALENLLAAGIGPELTRAGATLQAVRISKSGNGSLKLKLVIRAGESSEILDFAKIEKQAGQVLRSLAGLDPSEVSLDFN